MSELTHTYIAGANLERYTAVALSATGQLVKPADKQTPIGILIETAQAGKQAQVALFGVVKVRFKGNTNCIGQQLGLDSDGYAVALTSQSTICLGTALEAKGNDNIVRVRLGLSPLQQKSAPSGQPTPQEKKQ